MVAKSNQSSSNTAGPGSDKGRDMRFKGVRMRSWGKWVSEIRLPNTRSRLWLGSYATAEQAARAFDVAVVCLRGRSAALNFPESPPIFAPLGLPHHQIQELAAAAASSPAHASHSPPPLNIADSCCQPLASSPETSSIFDELDTTTSYTNTGCSQSPPTTLDEESASACEELRLLDENRSSALMRSSLCLDENRSSPLMRSSLCLDGIVHDEMQLIGSDWNEALWGNSTFDSNWISECAPPPAINDDDDIAAMADPQWLWSL